MANYPADFEHTNGKCNICGGPLEAHTTVDGCTTCPPPSKSKFGQWLLGQPRDGGKHEVCPPEFLPTVRQNSATGGTCIEFPDVCYCNINGGADHELHLQQTTCPSGCDGPDLKDGMGEEYYCTCHPDADEHAAGCPLDTCPIGQCHPMCSQVTGDANELYCHCPCHG